MYGEAGASVFISVHIAASYAIIIAPASCSGKKGNSIFLYLFKYYFLALSVFHIKVAPNSSLRCAKAAKRA